MQIELRVTDHSGHPVTDLARTDFLLSENGVAQNIATFDSSAMASIGRMKTATPLNDPAANETSGPTRIYILTDLAPPSGLCGSTWEYELFFRGVRTFLEQQLRPGTQISFNGTGFTGNRDKLLETLDLLRRYPNGRSAPGKPDWVPSVISGHGILEQGLECDHWTVGNRFVRPPPAVMFQLGRVTLERYIDLTQKLGQIEGKKTVVLFSRGLDFGRDVAFLLNRLSVEALRAQVTFYSVIPQALRGPNSNLADEGSADRATRGLFAVAENTGGRAVFGTNDFAEVFHRIYADNSNYYLLGYYPRDQAEKGRFRRISVAVRRPRVQVRTTKGYYEPKSFQDLSGSEKKMLLESQALGDRSYADIPLNVSFEFFRNEDGRSALAFSVGVPAERVPIRESEGHFAVDLKIMARATDVGRKELPAVMEQAVQFTLNPAQLAAARSDPIALFQFPSRMELGTGTYDFKVVVRDERDGKVGSHNSLVEVPAFTDRIAPSSLLLTAERTANRTTQLPGIDAGPFRYFPHSTNVFLRGQSIYAVYVLYNVPQEILASPPGPRVFLMLAGKQLEKPPFPRYEVFPSAQENALAYVAILDAAALAPGEYNLVVALPNSENGISRKFTLVEK